MVRYCAVSNIEHSHRMAITDIQWIPEHIEVDFFCYLVNILLLYLKYDSMGSHLVLYCFDIL